MFKESPSPAPSFFSSVVNTLSSGASTLADYSGRAVSRVIRSSQHINPLYTGAALTGWLFSMLPLVAAAEESERSADFSGFSFSLGWRETFEAALIVSMLLQAINRSTTREEQPLTKDSAKALRKSVGYSVIAGLSASGLLGSTFLYLFYEHGQEQLSEEVLDGIEGSLKLIISVLIANFGIEILTLLSPMQDTTRFDSIINSASLAATSKERYLRIGRLPFTICFIEMFEAIILIGVSQEAQQADSNGIGALVGSAAAGMAVSLVSLALFHRFGDNVPRNAFRYASAGLLSFIAAGMAAYGVHELQEIKFFGNYGSDACYLPWYNREMWNWSDCCNDKSKEGYKFLRTFLGYQDKGTPLELITWLSALGVAAARSARVLQAERNLIAQRNISSQIEVIEADNEMSAAEQGMAAH